MEICANRNSRGELEVLHVTGWNHHVRRKRQSAANVGPWTAWNDLDAGVVGICLGKNQDGRLELFSISPHRELWHQWENQSPPTHDSWGSAEKLDDGVIDADVARNLDGRLEVFSISPRHDLWHQWQVSAGGWGAARILDQQVVSVRAAHNADGRLEVFSISPNVDLWHQWQIEPGAGWSQARVLDTQVSRVAVAMNADGRLEVFSVTPGHELWHQWQLAPNGNWSGAVWLDDGVLDVCAVSAVRDKADAAGCIEVFSVGADRALWHYRQTMPNGGWAAAENLGTPAAGLEVGSICAVRNEDRRVEVFATAPSARGLSSSDHPGGHVWHRWQQPSVGGGFSGWADLDLG